MQTIIKYLVLIILSLNIAKASAQEEIKTINKENIENLKNLKQSIKNDEKAF